MQELDHSHNFADRNTNQLNPHNLPRREYEYHPVSKPVSPTMPRLPPIRPAPPRPFRHIHKHTGNERSRQAAPSALAPTSPSRRRPRATRIPSARPGRSAPDGRAPLR
ncbi:hypothetical protein GCM10009736_28270 [Actinomadura bangladeshensis]